MNVSKRNPLPTNDLLQYARLANAGPTKPRSAPPPAPRVAAPVAPPAAAVGAAEEPPVVLQLPPPVARPAAAAPAQATPARASASSRREVALLALVSLCGALVVLYRNDVLLRVAQAAGLDAGYSRLEQAMGGPGYGTPRSLMPLLHAAGPAKGVPGDAERAGVATPAPATVEKTPASPLERDDEPTPASPKAGSASSARTSRSPAVSVTRPRAPAKSAGAGSKAVVLEDESPKPSKSSKAAAEPRTKAAADQPVSKASLDDAIRAAIEKK